MSLRKSTASERLLTAALEMFSTKGMAATTREIPDTAVVEEVVRAESEALDRVDFVDFDMPRATSFNGMIFAAVLRRAVFSPGY